VNARIQTTEWLNQRIDHLEAVIRESQIQSTESEQREAEEKAIVDRIWDIFGRPSYESLHGKTIYDLITDLQQENDRLRKFIQNLHDETLNQSLKLLCEQALAAKEKP
jgi:restriction endonuclease